MGPAPSTAIPPPAVGRSELKHDSAVRGVAESLLERVGKGRRLHVEDLLPRDHIELVACRQSLQLSDSKRRIAGEHRPCTQHHLEDAIRNLDDHTPRAAGALDLPDHVDVVDALEAADVVRFATDPGFDATADNIAE